jgi:hypothetical protein
MNMQISIHQVAALFNRVRNRLGTTEETPANSSRHVQFKVLLTLALDATEMFVSTPFCIEGTYS